MDGRKILLYLSLKYDGDWDKVFNAIMDKENVPLEELTKVEERIKSKYLTIMDDEYPEYLKKTYKPPIVLYYYGDISLISNLNKLVAMVGTREPSEYGIEMTQRIASGIAKKKIVVSGLAKGIDAISHQTVIDNGGKTIAVLGSGIDYCYPSENVEIYKEIKKNHLLLSEYPNRVTPNQNQFPFRNRIVATLAEAVVVTEAKGFSGTLITINHALALGRDVLCVPERAIYDSVCNRMIKEGAALVENAEDVLDELHQ